MILWESGEKSHLHKGRLGIPLGWAASASCAVGVDAFLLVLLVFRQLQPSDTHRTRCLILAIADILWRAGGRQRAVVAL